MDVQSNIPIGSMYGVFTYIWLIFMVNVGKYSIHGSYGISIQKQEADFIQWSFFSFLTGRLVGTLDGGFNRLLHHPLKATHGEVM